MTRVKNPSVRDLEALRDEAARAGAMETLRADVRRGWAKESTCRGALATKAERYEDAERCFAQAIELDPTSVRAYVARGACRANQRRYAEAMADFDKALSVDAGERWRNRTEPRWRIRCFASDARAGRAVRVR